MARYTDSVCRQCRREGEKLFLKGDRCYTAKCAIIKRHTPPGQHGQARQRKQSEYGLQLREKQKCRRAYGISESQFRKYYDMASNMRGITGDNMLCLLERRLDNVVYRMGIAVSRSQARQLVTHAHFNVNGRPVDIASFQVKVGDVISVKEGKKSSPYFEALKNSAKSSKMPKWLDFDTEKLEGKILALPTREDIDSQINEQMIVELYSK